MFLGCVHTSGWNRLIYTSIIIHEPHANNKHKIYNRYTKIKRNPNTLMKVINQKRREQENTKGTDKSTKTTRK